MNKQTQKIGGLFLNGEYQNCPILQKFDLTVACDGGYNNAIKSGIVPDILLGDMDSVGKIPTDTQIFTYPKEKDFTDGEAGLNYLIENGCTEIYIYFGLGKRLSHTISNIQMATKHITKADITFFGMEEKVLLKNKSFKLNEKIGTTISIAPISGDVHIITSKGLKYPIEDLTLKADSARGVSNVATSESQEVIYQKGILLVSVWEG